MWTFKSPEIQNKSIFLHSKKEHIVSIMDKFDILGAASLILILTGCGSKEQENATYEVTVKATEITTSEVSVVGNYSGTVEEENGTSLSFAVVGTIDQLKVKMGDRVSKGQLIATVDDTSIRNNYEAAKAALTQAQDAYNRMKQLHDNGSLPEIKWVETQSQLEQAEANEKIAKKNLNDCSLTAPYSGVISEKNAEVGQNVMPGTPVVKLVTARQLDVKISVPETEMADIKVGQEARIKVQALGGKIFSGTVREKGIVANAASRSYDVKIRVLDADADLLPGMVTEVALTTPATAPTQKIVVPANAVSLGDDNSNFLWIAENNKAVRRPVTIGEYTPDGVTITSGLSDGDLVIVEGQQKVCVGTSLNVKKVEAL